MPESESDDENVRPDSSREWLHCEVIVNVPTIPCVRLLMLSRPQSCRSENQQHINSLYSIIDSGTA